MLAAVKKDTALAGRALRATVYFNDEEWCHEILDAASSRAFAACNQTNKAGTSSSLVLACWHGNLNLTRFLLSAGAQPNLEIPNGWSPLQYTANRGALDVCELLLSAGALVDQPSADGWTALTIAAHKQSGCRRFTTRGRK